MRRAVHFYFRLELFMLWLGFLFFIEQVFDAVPHKKDSEDTPNLIDKMSDD
jgi:hypothetical protein